MLGTEKGTRISKTTRVAILERLLLSLKELWASDVLGHGSMLSVILHKGSRITRFGFNKETPK